MYFGYSCTAINDFNSIKVRLEPIANSSELVVRVFQFHKGAIRTDIYVIGRDSFVISIP